MSDLSPDPVDALKAVLLFYDPQWTLEKITEWRRIIGTPECTTKIMCDHIRSVIEAQEAKAQDKADEPIEIARLRQVERAAKQVLANWDEFGTEGGLDEYMDGLRGRLQGPSDADELARDVSLQFALKRNDILMGLLQTMSKLISELLDVLPDDIPHIAKARGVAKKIKLALDDPLGAKQ